MYLVTGGAGFIGSHLAAALAAAGEELRILDDLSNGSPGNLAAVAGAGGRVDVVEGDIRHAATVERAMAGVHTVFHLAALGSVARSVADPLTSNDVNVTGTLRLLDAARRAKVRRFVFSSSSSVYGEDPVLPKKESQSAQPISPYATSKLAGENYARAFHCVYGMDTVSLRYFNVFGPRQRPDSQYAAVIPLFMKAAIEGGKLTVFGDGKQSRDFTYVDNVVRANLLAARAEGVGGRVYNVACGDRHSLLDIIASLERVVGRPLERDHREARVGDIRHTTADISAARRELGFEVTVGFDEGLRRTWAAFQEDWARGDAAAAHD